MKIQGRIDIHSFVEKLKVGAKFLPQVNWSSPSGLRISLAASLLGATGFVLAVKDGKVGNFIDNFGLSWSSSDRLVSSDENWVVPGLQNLGNNCFLNVVLQALASCLSFQIFLDSIFKEYRLLGEEEKAEELPLAAAVASLLEDLCMIQDVRSVRSPRKVMVAMESYMASFHLTRQQDAEEAFFHLLSSLRKELSEYYVPEVSSLAVAGVLVDSRILPSKKRYRESEQQRWWRTFLGPFDGILGSILICQSCSFQIGLDFQQFNSLHLSPVAIAGCRIMSGCSLEGCLSQFFVPERLDNYFCSHCWHNAAIKYLSLTREKKEDIEKLKLCGEDDSCECRSLCSLRPLPWLNNYSRSFQQLSMARSPQILSVHLQRVSVNSFGELVKLQGHISFPLILDLSPFMKRGLVIKNLEENTQRGQGLSEHQPPFPCPIQPIMEHVKGLINCNRQIGNKFPLEAENPDHEQIVNEMPKTVEAPKTWQNIPEHGSIGTSRTNGRPIHSNDKVTLEADCPSTSTSSKDHMYRLVSVIQHYGRVGSGHYIVYRRAKAEPNEDYPVGLLEPAHVQWFCISDSEVHRVSEKEVLEAEASQLFYEKIHRKLT